MKFNQKEKIREHYDVASPYYYSLWGIHLHDGFWKRGDETPKEAQEALTKELVDLAKLGTGLRILDAGCGLGGSSIYLTKHLGAHVTGITISPVQVEMARKFAAQEGAAIDFRVMDADHLSFHDQKFDCVWSVGAISHFNDREKFFKDATGLLPPGGTIAVMDWFKKEGLPPGEEKKYIPPIEKGMLIELSTKEDYTRYLEAAGNTIVATENISKEVAKTWDLCLDIIKDPSLWSFALKHGPEFIDFLKSFKSMREGYLSGALECVLIVARKAG